MKRQLQNSFSVLFIILCTIVCAQTGSIKGVIKTSDGKPAEFINIGIKGTSKGTATNNKGEYEIKNIESGSYTLITSFVGLQPKEQVVEVKANEETIVPEIVLNEDQKLLNEVVINANTNKFAKKGSDYIARMPLKNIENPQVYSVISNDLIKEQVSVDPREVLRNATGAAPVTYPAGGLGITSRGFSTGVNARNGMETAASRSSIDIANVDRIEVIKGPSGTLFGASISSFGGVVNLVTKKPVDAFKIDASYTFGSYGLNRISADINTPLNKERTVLFRLNTAVNKQNSFLNYGHNNAFIIAPSLLYKVSDRLTVLADAEFLSINQTRVMYTRVNAPSGFDSPDDIPLAYNKTLFLDDANAKTNSNKAFLEARYQLAENWTSSTLFSFVSEQAIHSYQYYPTWLTPTKVGRNVLIYGPIYNNYTNVQENITGKFTTGFIKHNVLIGASFRYYNGEFNYSTIPAKAGFIDTIDIIANPNFTALNKAKIDQVMLAKGAMVPFGVSKQNTLSGYVTDVLNFTDRLSLMLSLRVDHYDYKGYTGSEPYKQVSLAPKVGAVYQIIKNQLSVFANYMSGFQNLAPIIQPPPDGSRLVLKPIFANQSEGGIKAELFQRKANITVSYYNIAIDNATRTNSEGITIQDAKQLSKGVEAEMILNPIAGLNIIGGYAYNDNRIIKTTNPAIEGNKAAGAPATVVNYWISYKFQRVIKDVGIGFGGNYVEKAYLATDNIYFIPKYNVLNAALFYDQARWALSFKLNN
jgi:iron complex outermembrane recepter protein